MTEFGSTYVQITSQKRESATPTPSQLTRYGELLAIEPLLITQIVADIRQTRALMDPAERYCSKSDFSMKSLEPVV